MKWALVKKNFDESKLLLGSCFLAVVVICTLRIWIVSQIETSNFKQIIEWLPGDLENLSPVPFAWLVTYPGRIALTYQEPVILLCLVVWCIARASDCVSGELGRGTLEMLLAQPVSRMQLLWSHTLVTILGVAVISVGTFLGLWLGIQVTTIHEKNYPSLSLPIVQQEIPLPFLEASETEIPMREKANVWLFFPAAVNFFCYGVMLCGFTASMSSWDRYRWRTIGIVVAFHICQALTKLLAMAAPAYSWMLYLSIYSAYEPE
jgi:ABC-2 type transport system permease protein